ncbi:uncharacterized protein PITG_03829 [Phytophthora infestans T30-4]|uniref:J domain-containing protein n=1 Tax=Phytophthora infestans (strain T30-4) TaxID=403677 RepID=D0MYM4_PHYIT|nr:uncharacterized protein PITG_03829 [Phytophthora infestans T30-4]EEY66272.1 conserved hypothetical protein [Phytophthora infestans T30-4]|eukprot:XP_002906871.1 conserved hypothetical protein [Phytophthora infestans T30-4]
MSASAAAVQVCEQATSDAPSKCLAVTKHDRTLPTTLRVQLCQRASSDSPQQCFRSLRKFINARRMDNYDAVMTCQQAESIGPAECVAELFHAIASVTRKVVAQLCHAAKDVEPARCFAASPTFYDDELKVLLCNQAESAAPALCAKSVVTRFAHQPSAKVSLCRGATTAAPAACAMEAPFGMDEESVVELCRSAKNTAPAQCAQEVLTSLNVPWHRVAQVCAGAASTTPGRCLAHYVRHSRLHFRALADHQVVVDCRHAVAQPSALRITKASYACPELRPKCPLQIVVTVLDQYGDPIVDNRYDDHDAGVVYMNAAFTGSYDKQHEYMHSGLPALQGSTYAKIVNGSAVFSNLIFTEAGVFTFTFRAGEGVSDEVARVVVHPDLTAEALQNRCEKLFTHFQCSAESAPTPKRDYQRNDIQMLLLPCGLQLSAVTCGEYWMENIGGLAFRGFSATKYVVYVLPRPFYDLFTHKHGHPTTRRPVIRRAYHQRSLEWHPDKWHALAASLPPIWQQELGGVYVLITQAYDQLTSSKKLEGTMQEALLAILRGVRNGSFYGTKVRAPHALVMIFLFQKGSIRQKLRGVVRLTFEHSKNLALFVGVYKSVLVVLRAHQEHALERHVGTGVGKPGAHWHAAVAGGIGGYLVWGRYSSVNFQIVMYLMSRVLISLVRMLAAKGYQPFAQHRFKHVYPLLATVVWASVMWLYENEPHSLHPSLLKSMQFLYDESCRWKDGLVEFLPSPVTTAVFLLTWLRF